MEAIFGNVLESMTGNVSFESVMLCSMVSILLGVVIAFVYMKCGSYTKNFVISLAMLPILVQIVIMMVNGNLGTSVAVLGAFSLVRFRSLPGTSKEIVAIFFSMAVGLATGMGCVGYAFLFVLIVSVLLLVLSRTSFGETNCEIRELKITIPENLDYTGVFDDIFQNYTNGANLIQVKSTNMGSLFELLYQIQMKDRNKEKEMLDAIRCRNGNLTVLCRREKKNQEEL